MTFQSLILTSFASERPAGRCKRPADRRPHLPDRSVLPLPDSQRKWSYLNATRCDSGKQRSVVRDRSSEL